MKIALLIAILTMALLPSCTHVGVARSKKDGTLVAGVTSVLGEVISKDVSITTAEGDTINIGALATHNPDRNLTEAGKDLLIFKAAAPIISEGVKGANAIGLKGTKDPNIIPKDPNIIPVDPQFVPPVE